MGSSPNWQEASGLGQDSAGSNPASPTMKEKDLEERVTEIWGSSQFDWTVGRSPEGWFYYCGTMITPTHKNEWKHSGHEDTLVETLQKMIYLKDKPSNRLS